MTQIPRTTMPTAVPDTTLRGRTFPLDLVRAFAMLTIILTHTTGGQFGADGETLLRMFVGSASLFFMTSGALILPVHGSGKAFVLRRVKSYLPQLLFWSLVYAGLQWHFSPEYDLRRHLIWILFTPTWSPGWFLYALTGLYMAAPFISPWIARASRRSIEIFLVIWLASGLIPFAHANFYFNPVLTFAGPFYGFLGFMVAGYYLTRWPLSERRLNEKILFWCVTSGIGIAGGLRAFVTASRWGYAGTLTYDLSVNVMAMCLLWFGLCSYAHTAPRWIRLPVTVISVSSLGIYLVHSALFDYWIADYGWPWWLNFIVVTVISTVAGWFLRYLRLK